MCKAQLPGFVWPAEEGLRKWRDKADVIAGGLFTLLKGEQPETEMAGLGMDCLGKADLSMEGQTKIIALLFRVGKFTDACLNPEPAICDH